MGRDDALGTAARAVELAVLRNQPNLSARLSGVASDFRRHSARQRARKRGGRPRGMRRHRAADGRRARGGRGVPRPGRARAPPRSGVGRRRQRTGVRRRARAGAAPMGRQLSQHGAVRLFQRRDASARRGLDKYLHRVLRTRLDVAHPPAERRRRRGRGGGFGTRTARHSRARRRGLLRTAYRRDVPHAGHARRRQDDTRAASGERLVVHVGAHGGRRVAAGRGRRLFRGSAVFVRRPSGAHVGDDGGGVHRRGETGRLAEVGGGGRV